MKLHTRKEVAEIIGVCTKTISNWSKLGKGPRFIEIEGLPRCREDDLLSYIEESTPGNPKNGDAE